MEHLHPLGGFYNALNPVFLTGAIVVLLAILGKAADGLVDEAVVLSERFGLPKIVIGATVVSLGTTMPEAAVSVLAAVQGNPGLALGNAVGSVICDTGLILGIACLIAPPLLPRQIVNRQGWLQFAAGFLLVAACWPWTGPVDVFQGGGGNLSQTAGFVFLALLAGYLWLSVHWSRKIQTDGAPDAFEHDSTASSLYTGVKFVIAILLVVGSSWALIPAVKEAAQRLGVPEGIIAATLVAFGTSLPELVTAVTASRRGHGDLAVGNIIGADILNILFVAGAAAAVTPAGLTAGPEFFQFLFPAMLGVLIVFRVGTLVCPERLPRPFGVVLLVVYVIAIGLCFKVLVGE